MPIQRDQALDISRRVVAALNARDWTALADVMDSSAAKGFQSSAILAAFPDIVTHIDAHFADGDYIITRWTNVATHTGSYMGIAPTHRAIQFSGIAIDQIVNGKIVPMWIESDLIGLLQQLGRDPEQPLNES
ncbi:MAG: ester cyclase [Roseiflexaceae bacterium]|nr:ester cyclase [Roseiflexaceae bacterium]